MFRMLELSLYRGQLNKMLDIGNALILVREIVLLSFILISASNGPFLLLLAAGCWLLAAGVALL